jgi:hypothetical protein
VFALAVLVALLALVFSVLAPGFSASGKLVYGGF